MREGWVALAFLLLMSAGNNACAQEAATSSREPIWLDCSVSLNDIGSRQPKRGSPKLLDLTLIWYSEIPEIDFYFEGHAFQADKTTAGNADIFVDFTEFAPLGMAYDLIIDRTTLDISYSEQRHPDSSSPGRRGAGKCKIVPPKPLPKRQI